MNITRFVLVTVFPIVDDAACNLSVLSDYVNAGQLERKQVYCKKRGYAKKRPVSMQT